MGYNLLQNTVYLGKNSNGRRNGNAVILFDSAQECNRAMNEMQGKYIGSRYLQLYQVTYGEYQEFQGAFRSNDVKLSKYITSSNKQRALLMRGLPFKVTRDEIQSFFSHHAELMKTDIVIEEYNDGKRSGAALVFFEDEDTA